MTTNGDIKVPLKFSCLTCDYNTIRKSQYERHLITSKHKMIKEALQNGLQKVQKSSKNMCECGKEYLHRQSLYKHKRSCKLNPTKEEPLSENNQSTTDLIHQLLKQNQEFKELIIEQNKQMLEMSKVTRQGNPGE